MRSSISRPFSYLALSAGLLLLSAAPQAAAAVLDWNDPNVVYDQQFVLFSPQTTISQTFTDINGTGVDVTISLTLGSSNTAQTEVTNPASGGFPDAFGRLRDNDVNFNNRGGALDIGATFSGTGASPGTQTRATDFVRITIEFSEAVSNISFSLWDIDYTAADSGYQDIVRNFMANGSNSMPQLTIAGSNVSTFNSGTALRGIDSTADTATASDVGVNYGSTTLTSVSFDYAPGDGAGNIAGPGGTSNPLFSSQTNPSYQHIGLGNITFTTTTTPVPEVFSGRGALFACVAVMAAPLFGRRRRVVEA